MSISGMLLVALFVLACLLGSLAGGLVARRVALHYESRWKGGDLAEMPSPRHAEEPEPLPEVPASPAALDRATHEPRVIDEHNPPYYRVYRPRGGYNPQTAIRCTCHGRLIANGEKVLLWPVPASDGVVDVFCVATYGVMDR